MKFNNETLKKVSGIAFAIGAGVFAVINSLSEQKRDEEFEDLKKTVEELKNK
jgi:hypothetical protein